MIITDFSEMVDTLVKAWDVVKKAKEFTSDERKKYREVIDNTYTMLDSAILLVLNRLGDIIMTRKRTEFVNELRGLYNFSEWEQIEKNVRLCKNLRYAGSEMTKIWERYCSTTSLIEPNRMT